VTPIIYQMKEIFDDSTPASPLLLILTPGNDPMEQIKKFGEEKQKLYQPVSLGRGMGERAKQLIKEMRKGGGWVVL